MAEHGITGLGARQDVPETWGTVWVMDSGSSLDQRDRGGLVVAGSHCSEMAARFIIPHQPRAVILHDAGRGKADCGIAGLRIFEVFGIPAAAVDCASARIGDGGDVYAHGLISACNDGARRAGVELGMPAREAMRLMAGPDPAGAAGRVTSADVDTGRPIWLADTASFLGAAHANAICVVGSHGSDIVAHHLIGLRARAVFANDAGGGKDNAGFSGLALLDAAGIPAAVYDCSSAIIGNARDAWENGRLSQINPRGLALGWRAGLPVQAAIKAFD